MGEYTFRTLRKLLCATLVFSLLGPDVARCMEDKDEGLKHHSIVIIKEEKTSPEDLKNEASQITVSEEDTNKDEDSTPIPSSVNPTETNAVLPEKKEELSENDSSENNTGENNNSSRELKNEEEKNEINFEKDHSQASSSEDKAVNTLKIVEEGEDNNPQESLLIEEKNGKDEKENESSKVPTNSSQENSTDSSPYSSDFTIIDDFSDSQWELNEKSSLLPKGGNIQGNELDQETLSEKYLRLLKINPQNLDANQLDALQKIAKIEGTWRNSLIWSNLVILTHKALFALTTNKNAVNKRKQKKTCDPLWLHGGPVPLEDDSAINRNVVLKTLGGAIEEAISESLETIFVSLMGYQIYELIMHGKASLNLIAIVKFWLDDSDTVSSLAVIKALHTHPSLFALLGVPVGFVIAKTLWNVSQISKPTKKTVEGIITDIHNRSPQWDSWVFSLLSVLPTLSSLLMFHPMKRKIPGLAIPLLWEGDLDSEARENAFTALLELAESRDGITQMTALQSLAYLVHGNHLENLVRLKPHGTEGLLKIKLSALHELEERYKKLPDFSLNKARTTILLWEMGHSPSWRASIAVPVLKAIALAFYVYGLVGLGKVLYEYIKCPAKYLNNFTWLGGTLPYAGNYSKECFDAQVKAFNLIPGQPADTLVGNKTNNLLLNYLFPNKTYDLDLSNKGIEGSIIADIVEAFQNASITLNSLNIAKNSFHSSDLARILNALPPRINHLCILNRYLVSGSVFSASFSGLGNLTNLQNLSLGGFGLAPYNNDVMGHVLQNLFHLRNLKLLEGFQTNLIHVFPALKTSLQVLDLSNSAKFFNCEQHVALGNALAKNLTLQELYLGKVLTPQYSEGNFALAQGLKAQTQLKVLDINQNNLGNYSNVNISVLLSYLPSSLTHLDVSANSIGSQSSSEVAELAHAVQKMWELTFFNAEGNTLGNSPDFLTALHHKQNLTFLDLSRNSFKNTTQMKGLLQTTPNLKTLDLSYNHLTNGSLLAPILTKFQNLTNLNLGGNLFTTEDRMAIWNAGSSFLLNSPFYLDEDLNFTIAYLHSLHPNTTNLNFATLIPKNSTAFEAIMNQTVDRFPNLRELDLSSNYIGGLDTATNTPRGIEALIYYLPQLKNLQYLKMSGCSGSNASEANAYYQNLSYTIGRLSSLRSLDLSYTDFFYADFLGNGLKNSHSLTSVNLKRCWWWWYNPALKWGEGEQLINGLKAHSNLTDLNLSRNSVGTNGRRLVYSPDAPDPNSTRALTNNLGSWPQLQSLDLSWNAIGYEHPNSSVCFLEKLANLSIAVNNKTGKTLTATLLGGIYNVTWTNEAQNFQKIVNKPILDACAKQLCSGGNITTQAKTKAPKLQKERRINPVTSSTSRPIPFYQPVISSLKSWFSVKSWAASFDKALDSVTHVIQSYSQHVVKNAPPYFSGTLDSDKLLVESANKGCFSDLIPHFRVLDQSPLLQIERFNYVQKLNHTSSPLMLSSGSHPLALSK